MHSKTLATVLVVVVTLMGADAILDQVKKHFPKAALKAYEEGVHHAEKMGSKVIGEGFKHLCEGAEKGAGHAMKMPKCDSAHANNEFCKAMATGATGAQMLCHMAAQKGEEWYGKAAGCLKEPKAKQLNCMSVWYEEMKLTAETIKAGAEAAG
ncbi:unnamed protein product [Medioppia subpectinata]|uniref:Uncharacterized protein n=1 Tax=Medioppia subpectinata TaxID=1979941 RepID=A0A7R9KRA3_9ACAR|nr:unnamed protein product [Medioppia subpectinata]CAG2108356.1 unnamed protein product [Medioppia subpectinata]